MKWAKTRWIGDPGNSIEHAVELKLQSGSLLIPRQFNVQYVQREYEPLTQKSFLNVLREGMVVLDVGAHVGFYSVIAAHAVGPTGKIHAVEPCADNLTYLRTNIERNNLKNIIVHPYAAGKEHAQRQFHITGSSDSHGFYPHPNTGTNRLVEVTQVSLDELVSGSVHAVKLDVEGAEIEVLLGMKQILANNPNLVLWAEWFPAGMKNAGCKPLDLLHYIKEIGFDNIQVIDDNARKIYSFDEAAKLVASGNIGPSWYSNIWAKRQL